MVIELKVVILLMLTVLQAKVQIALIHPRFGWGVLMTLLIPVSFVLALVPTIVLETFLEMDRVIPIIRDYSLFAGIAAFQIHRLPAPILSMTAMTGS